MSRIGLREPDLHELLDNCGEKIAELEDTVAGLSERLASQQSDYVEVVKTGTEYFEEIKTLRAKLEKQIGENTALYDAMYHNLPSSDIDSTESNLILRAQLKEAREALRDILYPKHRDSGVPFLHAKRLVEEWFGVQSEENK